MVNAVLQNDLYAVIGSIVIIGVVFVVTNLVVDVVQLGINPRLRDGGFATRARGTAVLAARSPQPGLNGGVG